MSTDDDGMDWDALYRAWTTLVVSRCGSCGGSGMRYGRHIEVSSDGNLTAPIGPHYCPMCGGHGKYLTDDEGDGS